MKRDAIGGPVIGSGLMVTKDPDTGVRNVSFHRLQIKGPHKSGVLLYPRRRRGSASCRSTRRPRRCAPRCATSTAAWASSLARRDW